MFRFLCFSLFLTLSLFARASEERVDHITHPNGVSLSFTYDEEDNLIDIHSSDRTIAYTLEEKQGNLRITDRLTQQVLHRQVDTEGRLLKEIFPSGHAIEIIYQEEHPIRIKLSTYGEIHYEYEKEQLTKVKRLAPTGELLYEHTYLSRGPPLNPPSEETQEQLIGNLGKLTHHYDPQERELTIESTLSSLGRQVYRYDAQNQLLIESAYDPQGNPLEARINEKGEMTSYRGIECTYDANGNLLTKKGPKRTGWRTDHFAYDALNRLIQTSNEEEEIHYTYDLFGRRLSKKRTRQGVTDEEIYLYIDDAEIAVCANRELKHLRIPGKTPHSSIVKAIAIESEGRTYAPIYDNGYNLYQLIDIQTKEVLDFATLHPFGENLHSLPPIPWIYAAKHYDPEIDLVYFGYRYYDPSLRRWITRDPEEEESSNSYHYNRNNPLRYFDPDGRFALAIPLITWGAAALTDLVVEGGHTHCCRLGRT
jgi:RHS repeat-associated protein